MQLKNLKLPGSVISGLYRQSLVITDEKILPAIVTGEADKLSDEPVRPVLQRVEFLGENKKNILVLVNYENIRFLPDEELSFLTGMLSACKLTLADVAIVNFKNTSARSYKEFKTELNSQIFFLFGTTPESISMPVSFPHFQVQSFNNNTFLSAPSLVDIQNDKILESKLWVCLRRIFNV